MLTQRQGADSQAVVEFIRQTHLLRELSFGVREGLSRSLSVEEAKAEVARRRNVPVCQIHDKAESLSSVLQRQVEFLIRLKYSSYEAMRTSQRDETQPFKVLCVAHGGFIGQFLQNFCPTMVQEKPKIGNCSLSVITIQWPVGDNVIGADDADRILQCEEEVRKAINATHGGSKFGFTCTLDPEQFNMCIE